MKSIVSPLLGAALGALLAVGAASAATPSAPAGADQASAASTGQMALAAATAAPSTARATAGMVLTDILGLSSAQIMSLRQQGLSLAQIAARQNVDPQRLIDALVAQWSTRIDARVSAGALTADQAKTLKANLATQAKAMVSQTAMGGMRGAAVGAGPTGAARGMGGAMGGAMGAGRGGMMRGAAGACPFPVASSSPAS